MVELKPCPFCGGKAELDFATPCYMSYIDSNGEYKYMDGFFTVQCECGCRIGTYESPDIAIESWNKRMKYE